MRGRKLRRLIVDIGAALQQAKAAANRSRTWTLGLPVQGYCPDAEARRTRRSVMGVALSL